jgi:hypothetical protein
VAQSTPGVRAYRLEDVDILRERLDASYGEAREALEASGGDLVGALAYVERRRAEQASDLASFVRDAVEQVRTAADGREVKSATVTLKGQPVLTFPLALVGAAAGAFVLFSIVLSQCRVEVAIGERSGDGDGSDPPTAQPR